MLTDCQDTDRYGFNFAINGIVEEANTSNLFKVKEVC